jgi:prepilin-type N-terminal cleavage/methylation domain-containing protein
MEFGQRSADYPMVNLKAMRTGQKLNKRHAAFTLVEVICAAAIAAILFLALFFGIAQGFRILQTSRESLRATEIMVGRTEGLRLVNWTQLTNTDFVPGTFTNYFYPNGMGGSTNQGVAYAGTMTLSDVPLTAPDYTNAMKLVTVTVTWQDTHANAFGDSTITYTRSFKTFVAKHGIQTYVY